MTSPFAADNFAERSTIMGSHALLQALWRNHPAILKALADRGNSVVQPGGKP